MREFEVMKGGGIAGWWMEDGGKEDEGWRNDEGQALDAAADSVAPLRVIWRFQSRRSGSRENTWRRNGPECFGAVGVDAR